MLFWEVEHQVSETIEKAHGRLEIRKHWIIDDPTYLSYLDAEEKWKGLQAIGMVVAQRRIGDEVTTHTRYYLLSFARDVHRFASSIRSHWGIENSVHWVLDLAFREDESRIRMGHADSQLGGAPSLRTESASPREDRQNRHQSQTPQSRME